MKAWNTMSLVTAAALAMGALATNACGGDDETGDPSGPGSGGGDPTSSSTSGMPGSTTTASSTSGPSSTGGGGAPPGEGICGSELSIDGDVFDGCLSANCCDSFDPCAADATCADCLADPTFDGCDTNALYQAFQTCFDTTCPTTLCGSELGTASPNLNACIEANCCTQFSACEADAPCNACLQDPMGAGCAALVLFTDYQTCRDTSCLGDMCGSGIGYGITYDNGSQDTSFDSNQCADENCCTDLVACADPSGDGFPAPREMDAEREACIACLNADPSCAAGAVKTAAEAFNGCVMTNMCLE